MVKLKEIGVFPLKLNEPPNWALPYSLFVLKPTPSLFLLPNHYPVEEIHWKPIATIGRKKIIWTFNVLVTKLIFLFIRHHIDLERDNKPKYA